jgi:cytochrome c peroxidase
MSHAILTPPERVDSTDEPPLVDESTTITAREDRHRGHSWYIPTLVAIACATAALPFGAWTILRGGDEGKSFVVEKRDYIAAQPSKRPGEPVQPIVPVSDLDPGVVALGRRLFSDARLSGDGTVSCASCHLLANGGDDDRQASIGIGGQMGDVNAPTVLNSVFNFRQFWDGHAATLEKQVDGPIESPAEMGSSWEHVLQVVRSDPSYADAFQSAFQDDVRPEHVRHAISTFEASLTTPNSRFDQWLRGDDAALTERELRGYQLFKDYQCISCHQGVNLGGTMYQRLGVMSDYFTRMREERSSDLGRFNVTGNELDRHVFRVPGLRNVAVTGPYFHDGSAKTLQDAVRIMIKHQLGRDVNDADVELIAEFLKTLSGDMSESRP